MKTIKRRPVVTDVANQIRDGILEGALVPGSKIDQDELAAGLGVSRLPVRQALLVLQREGLVFLDHGRGAVVAPLDIKFISDLFDCRAIVEGYVAAALAVRRDFDPSSIRRIVADGRAAAASGQSRRDLIADFHTALYRATGNQVLIDMMNSQLDHVQRAVTFVRETGGLRSQADTWDEHAAILEAIAARRVGRARRLARTHVERVKQVVIAHLVSAAPSAARTSNVRPRGTRLGDLASQLQSRVIFDASWPK
jgi:DNA-binding GntR family transcriptional regulator